MTFSEWLEKRIAENLNPEIERLKRDEKLLLMSIENRKDPMGRVLGVNMAGYTDATRKLKEIRAKIKAIEEKDSPATEKGTRPLPAWMQGRKAV